MSSRTPGGTRTPGWLPLVYSTGAEIILKMWGALKLRSRITLTKPRTNDGILHSRKVGYVSPVWTLFHLMFWSFECS
jgi:hypothetical protein